MSTAFQVSPLNLSISSRELFKSFAHLPWSILLDSGNSNHIDAHHDIIVLEPAMTLVSDDELTTIVDTKTHQTKTSLLNPFDVLADELTRFEFCTHNSNLPFTGGALGLFGYDLGRHCESISSHSIKDIELPVMAVGIYKHALIFDRQKDSISVVSQSNSQDHQDYVNTVNAYLQEEKAREIEIKEGEQEEIRLTQCLDKQEISHLEVKRMKCERKMLEEKVDTLTNEREKVAAQALEHEMEIVKEISSIEKQVMTYNETIRSLLLAVEKFGTYAVTKKNLYSIIKKIL